MTLAEWRQREELVTAAHKLANDSIFRVMVEVLLNESPVNYQNPRLSADRTLGHIEGYNMCLNNLAAMSVPLGGNITIDADFSESNNTQPQE